MWLSRVRNREPILRHDDYADTNVLWEFALTESGNLYFQLTATAETGGGAVAGGLPMPEPSAAMLFLVGLSTVGCRIRRHR